MIPGLKSSLLDPVPEVRSVASRALGAIVKGMGESGFDDLLPWLMQTLTSENSSVDRSGAAQGKQFLSTPVHMHGGLICITLRPSVCPSVCGWTKIQTRN